MQRAPEPPLGMRPLGRSRPYADADLPPRLTHWHAPRANRWERLCVSADRLCTQWLGVSGATTLWLGAGEERWIAPGERWRVVSMTAQTCFDLQIYAADATPVREPQPLRAALLDDAVRVRVADGADCARLIEALDIDEVRLLQGRCDLGDALRVVSAAISTGFFWHPLDAGAQGFTVLVARATGAVGLLEYLGRDHAVIEAALAGALRGDAEYSDWLHATLSRHLAIEEQLLFPAYLDAGGREAWVRGLCNEHAHLRRYLAALSEPDAARRLLLLLDGHDEKEEQIVYPDILARLGNRAADLTRAAMGYPPAPGNATEPAACGVV